VRPSTRRLWAFAGVVVWLAGALILLVALLHWGGVIQ